MKKKSTKWKELYLRFEQVINVVFIVLFFSWYSYTLYGLVVIYPIVFIVIIFIWGLLTSQKHKKEEKARHNDEDANHDQIRTAIICGRCGKKFFVNNWNPQMFEICADCIDEIASIDETDSEKLRKGIYRTLVKKYHPDFASTPEEKEQFHKIMTEINTANETKNLLKLEGIAARLGIEKAEILKSPREKIDIDSQKTILYADDEEGLRLLIAEEFEDVFGNKIKTVVFESKMEAFDYLIHNKVDLIISDIKSPKIDGLDFLKSCKILYQELPFIFFTSYPHYKHDFGTYASDAYVVKSSDLSELIETVKEYLKIRHNTEGINSKIRTKDVKTLYDLDLAYKELTPEK